MSFKAWCDEYLLTDLERELAWAMIQVMRENPRMTRALFKKRRIRRK